MSFETIKLEDPAAKYFFHLAVCGKIRDEIEKLETLGSVPGESISILLSKNNLDSMKLLLDRKSTELYDYDLPYDRDGSLKYSKIELVENALIGKQPHDYSFPMTGTTDDLIIKTNGGEEFGSYINQKQTPKALYKKLHAMLRQTIPQFTASSLTDKVTTIEPFIVHYIDEVVTDESAAGLRSSVSSIFGGSGQVTPELFNIFFISFIQVLNDHLEILFIDFSSRSETQESILNSLRERGNNLMANSSYAQAIKVYTEALEIRPIFKDVDFPQLYTNRAIAFIGLNCVPEAITDLNSALMIDRVFTPAWTQLGYCYLYMGNSLTALEAYVTALKTAVGEILPSRFPKNESLIESYKQVKKTTVLPQFIKRLSGAIALTEKRAYQQHQPEQRIKKQLSDVRRILAHLRALGPDSDRDDFTYTPVYRDSSLRDMSARANTQNPNILTPEVTQNLLARNSMESTAVITPAEPFRRRTNLRRNTENSDDEETTFEIDFSRGPVNFSELFRSRNRNNDSNTNNETTRNTELNRSRANSDTRSGAARDEDNATREQTQNNEESRGRSNDGSLGTIRDVLLNAVSQVAGGGGGAASGADNDDAAENQGFDVTRFVLDQIANIGQDNIGRFVNGTVTVNGRQINLQNNRTGNNNNNNNSNSQTRGNNGGNSNTDTDIEMGDVPDLD
ncbi:HOP Hsp70-Hsp90 organizing protein [Candida maltosa Xu316]|uniref:Uncharacterized protein n=1 Tax=Candida maltosa (strain Xu316) TaxID=1245528 RepID=M3JSK9_CANMX|nr:hypothetical protein G210_4007 [Candida maltosa Xu316]